MQIGFDPELLLLLYDVARQMRTRADQRARTRGMTRAQWVILAHLERQPGLSQNELAAIVEVEPITIGRLVDRLEARGLVDCLQSVVCLGYNLDTLLSGEEHPEARAHHRLVVGDEHPDAHPTARTGSRVLSVKPPPSDSPR